MFDPPQIFVPEKADLVLPEHPDQNTTFFCTHKSTRIYNDLLVGINPNEDVSENNLPRILSRYMLPYLENVKYISDILLERALWAEHTFLSKPIDIVFDRHMLKTTVEQIKEYHVEVEAYLQFTKSAESLSDEEQVYLLTDHVLKPMFLGSGFEVIGDDTSEWVTFTAVFCEGIKLGVDLSASVRGHVTKWQKMGWDSQSGESVHETRSSYQAGLGLLGIILVAAYFSKK